MCRRCKKRLKMAIRGAALCEACHGTCRICGGPAVRTSSGYYRSTCAKHRRVEAWWRDTCTKCGGPRIGRSHSSYCNKCWNEWKRGRNRLRARVSGDLTPRSVVSDEVLRTLSSPTRSVLKALRRRLRNRGLTLDDWIQMLEVQGNKCAGCRAKRTTVVQGPNNRGAKGGLHLDHSHETNEIRGILCGTCNSTLGRVRDDPALLRRLALYLGRKPYGVPPARNRGGRDSETRRHRELKRWLVEMEGNHCATCFRTPEELTTSANQYGHGYLHLDHCHEKNVVRGLLCASCNNALGLVKDNPAVLRALAAYLEDPPARKVLGARRA